MAYAFQFMMTKQKEEEIRTDYETTKTVLRLECSEDALKIEYQEDGNDTLIVCNDPKNITRIFKELVDTLSSSNQKLQVHSIDLNGNVEQLMPIIPHFDTKVLMKIWVTLKQRPQNINDLLKMEYWRHAEILLLCFVFPISTTDLLFVKKAILRSKAAKKISMTGITYENEQIVIDAFGKPKQDDKCKIWTFPIPNNKEEILKIFLTSTSSTRRIDFVREKIKKEVQELFLENSNETNAFRGEPSSKVFQNNLIMKNILQHLQCFDIQRMRKVCSHFCCLIDSMRQDPLIEKIHITWFPMSCSVGLSLNDDSRSISYEQQESGCFVKANGREHFIPEDCSNTVLKDFGIYSRHQKSCLQELRLDFQPDLDRENILFLISFQGKLKSREQLLKVKNIHLRLGRQMEILRILPHIDPTSLKSIEIFRDILSPRLLEINELTRLEQWKKARELIVVQYIISTPIQNMNITHFAKVDITATTISSVDIFYLKEELLKSSYFLKFKINFKRDTVDETIHDLMGTLPHLRVPVVPSKRITWYFHIANTDQVLLILFHVSQAVIFSCIDLSKVPEEAVVQF